MLLGESGLQTLFTATRTNVTCIAQNHVPDERVQVVMDEIGFVAGLWILQTHITVVL